MVKSLDRALGVLETLSARQSATLSELATETGASPATVYRIMITLERHRMVEVDETSQRWHVGPGAFRVGAAFLRRTSVVERARPALRGLMEETGETANLGLLNDHEVLFVAQAETHAPIRAFLPPGTRSPLHASGIGKALLAHLPGPTLDRVLAGRLERFTAATLTDPAALRTALAEIREQGFAIDDEERTEGMRCVAACIRVPEGSVPAGISVSGPAHRLKPQDIPGLARRVTAAAARISDRLGLPQIVADPLRES